MSLSRPRWKRDSPLREESRSCRISVLLEQSNRSVRKCVDDDSTSVADRNASTGIDEKIFAVAGLGYPYQAVLAKDLEFPGVSIKTNKIALLDKTHHLDLLPVSALVGRDLLPV